MKSIEQFTTKKELFDFVFLVELIYNDNEEDKKLQLNKAMKKAAELGVTAEFSKELHSLEELKLKEESESLERSLSGESTEPERDKNGQLKKTIDNYLILMRSDEWFDSLCLNELTGRGEFNKRPINDTVRSTMVYYIERKYGLKSERDFEHALLILLKERTYHPIRERIKSLQWDKKSRIEQFLQRIMGAEDSEYTRECSRLIFHCGIARAFFPGCKVDDVIVLQGEQGNGKSTITSWLCMNEDWYGRVNDIKGNTGIEQLQGKWICEISELIAISGKDRQEEAKQYLDRKSDNYRRPYAQYSEEIPRQCIFIGTTNLRQPFSDKTGNRRYYPVWCSIKPGELYAHEYAVKKYIEQCWAEAYELWQRGEIHHAVKREMLEAVQQQQKNAVEDDWRVGVIESFVADKTETCIIEVWTEALGMTDKPSNRQSREIGLILDSLEGWEKGAGKKRFGNYASQRFWCKNETAYFKRIDDDYVEIVDLE